jgi:hypothetical protein
MNNFFSLGLSYLFCALMIPSLATAGEVSEKPKPSGLPALMHSFYGTLLELKPYMTSLDYFKDPKNSEKLKSILSGLEADISKNQPSEVTEPASFRVTYNLMARHLRDTIRLYEYKSYPQSWERLNATSNFCIACHTRLPEKVDRDAFEWAKKGSKLDSRSLQDAEFSFIAHQYPAALEIYNQKIRTFKKESGDISELNQCFERKLIFFSRVERNPDTAIASLELDAANKNLPTTAQQDIKDWIRYFKDLKKEQKRDFGKMSDKNLTEYAKSALAKLPAAGKIHMNDPAAISVLHLSGLLYERVFTRPDSKSLPEMLFLLAQAEKQLAPFRVYSLSDLYLSECVTKFPKSSIAKKCFEEYSVSMKTKFGEHAPGIINTTLESMREILDKK